MNDWLGLVFFVLLALGVWFGLRALSKPRKTSEQDFEKQIGLGQSLINAGMMELNKFLDPRAAKSIAVVRDLKNGRYNKKKREGKAGGDADTNNE